MSVIADDEDASPRNDIYTDRLAAMALDRLPRNDLKCARKHF